MRKTEMNATTCSFTRHGEKSLKITIGQESMCDICRKFNTDKGEEDVFLHWMPVYIPP
jgi:hypothetical protein